MCFSDVQILDYSNSQLLILDEGTSQIQDGTFKIIHQIDTHTLTKNIPISNSINPILRSEIGQIRTILRRLTPKVQQKRSLDFLGTTWKWIAGSPDHHDLDILTDNINNVLQNNDRQEIINQKFLDRINEISEMNNNVIKAIQESDRLNIEIEMELKYKLDLIKEELTNIEHAIHWAKANIVNSFILTNLEVKTIGKINNKLNYGSVEEILEFSDVRIATNGTIIIYIISLPMTTEENCKSLRIKEIKKENKVVKTKYAIIVKCAKITYGITNNCKAYNKKKIVM